MHTSSGSVCTCAKSQSRGSWFELAGPFESVKVSDTLSGPERAQGLSARTEPVVKRHAEVFGHVQQGQTRAPEGSAERVGGMGHMEYSRMESM